MIGFPIKKMRVLPLPIKYLSGGVLLALIGAGCVTRSQADAQARKAYLAGQQAALATLAGEGKVVAIDGPVKYPKVPWIEGLTLAQAIATAQYTGRHNPQVITITRQGAEISVNPHDLLAGHATILQAGDAVKIREFRENPPGIPADRRPTPTSALPR